MISESQHGDANNNMAIKKTEPVDKNANKKTKINKKVKEAMEDPNVTANQIIGILSKGVRLHKIRKNNKFFGRKYFVDTEYNRLHYTPSIKPYMLRDVPYCEPDIMERHMSFRIFTPDLTCTLYKKCVFQYNVQYSVQVDISEIGEVRVGWKSDRFNDIKALTRRKLQLNRPSLKEDNCFSLVFDDGTETEDLVATDSLCRDLWVKGLRHIMSTLKSERQNNQLQYWLREQFRHADKNKNRVLCFDEVLGLLKQINVEMDRNDAKELFDKVKPPTKKKLTSKVVKEEINEDEFVKLYQMLNSRPELNEIFSQIATDGKLGPNEMMKFLQEEQQLSKITLKDSESLIKRYEPNEGESPGFMTINGFKNMFSSAEFDIFDKKHNVVCHDMTQPLSHYYICSSHNTYLMSDQLMGKSSIEAYRLALAIQCGRCVELDVWDGEDNEPIIYHGWTRTTKIRLRDVLRTIHDYAFTASQYPVILSLENHCSVEQQVVMAQLMRDILGDYLLTEPLSEDETHWPSPEALSKKILIKNKRLTTVKRYKKVTRSVARSDSRPEELIERQITVEEEIEEEEESDEEEEETDEVRTDTTENNVNNQGSQALRPEVPNDATDGQEPSPQTLTVRSVPFVREKTPDNVREESQKLKLSKELSDTVVYCVAKRFDSFTKCFDNWKFYEMTSLDENKSLKLIESEEDDYLRFTSKHLCRIYPKGTRIGSSNYNPVPHWNAGAQLVALNFQTYDLPMLFNDALFSLNGNCGYVLKPDFIRKGLPVGDHHKSRNKPKRVSITVISGQHIPKPGNSLKGEVIDPYVKIRVYGHQFEEIHDFNSKVIWNNGFNPVWNETFEFVTLWSELAFIHIEVKDQSNTGKNELLGQNMIAFTALTQGYRRVCLFDELNLPIIPASILVKIKYQDEVFTKVDA